MELLIIAVSVVAGLLVLFWGLLLAFGALGFTFTGAAILFAFAAEQGFIGLAVYAAAWVFMFPLMLVVSLVLGFMMSERSDGEQAEGANDDRRPDVFKTLAEEEREHERRRRIKTRA